MRNGWRATAIGDVADVIGGGTPSTRDSANFDGDIPWLTPRDLAGYGGRYIGRGKRSITQKGLESSSARLLPARTVLVSTRAPVGYVAIADRPVTTNQGFRSLVLHDGHVPEFFYYLLKANRHVLEANATGTTFGELSGSRFKQLSFEIPEPSAQRAIAGVLGALDDKIEVNRRMNETLEALARTLFQRMTSEGGTVATLGEHVDIVRGRSYKSSELAPSMNALVTLKSFARGGGYRSDGLKPYVGEFKPPQVVAPGEVIIACTDVTQAAEVIGRPAVVLADPRYERLIASLDLVIVRPKATLGVAFLYFLLSAADFTEHAYAHTTGTTVLHLNRACIPSYEFALPSADVVAEFDALAQPMLDRIAANHAESRTLAELRDALLPKLISGKLRIVEEMSNSPK